MTGYFDTMSSRIHQLYSVCDENPEAVAVVERELVRDVTICAEWPGFPPDLRLSIHQLVLKHGVVTLPRKAPPADYAENREGVDRLRELNEGLHDVFHSLAHRELVWWGDSPFAPTAHLCEAGDEARERIVAGKPELPGRVRVIRDIRLHELVKLYEEVRAGLDEPAPYVPLTGAALHTAESLFRLAELCPKEGVAEPVDKALRPVNLVLLTCIYAERLPYADYLIRG